MNTPIVVEIQNALDECESDVPVYIYCGFNRYKIKRIIECKDYLMFDVGDVENPITGFYEFNQIK